MLFPKTICHGEVFSFRVTQNKSITAEMCLLCHIVVSVLLIAAEGGVYDLNTVFTLRCLPWHWCVCRPRGGL